MIKKIAIALLLTANISLIAMQQSSAAAASETKILHDIVTNMNQKEHVHFWIERPVNGQYTFIERFDLQCPTGKVMHMFEPLSRKLHYNDVIKYSFKYFGPAIQTYVITSATPDIFNIVANDDTFLIEPALPKT